MWLSAESFWLLTGFVTVGSIIQLANGSTKAVEELLTEDFIQSARVNRDVFLDQSTLVKISPQENSDDSTLTFSVGKDKLLVSFS